jgi:hypothetical protein
MNLFLETRWFRSAIGFSPEDLRVEYTRAYSLWPGRIHVEGLSIRGSDTSVEWILSLDSCDFRVHFLDLLHREFHADHVRGVGLSLRIRMRLQQDEGTPEVVAALPPIPGFSDPPYLEIGPPTLPLTDDNYNLWAIQLDDVDAQEVHELWIQTWRYTGDMRVRGRWLFRPMRWLEVGPATVDVVHLDVSHGLTRPLLIDLRGIAETTVHPFDVRASEGLEILRNVSARTAVTGFASASGLVETLVAHPSVGVAADNVPLDLRVRIDHGILQPRSRVELSSARIAVSSEDMSLEAGGSAVLRVETDDDARTVARVDVDISNPLLRQHLEELGRAASVSVQLRSTDLDLAHPSVDSASFAVELRGAWAPTVAFLRPILPVSTTLQSGVVRGDAHFEGLVGAESAHGNLEYSIRDVSLAYGSNRVSSNVEGTVSVVSASLPDGRVDLGGSRAALSDVVATLGGVRTRASSLSLGAERAVIQRGAPPDVTLDVHLPDAELVDLSDFNSFLPHTVSVARGKGRAAGNASVDLGAQEVRGHAMVVTNGLSVRLGSFMVTGRADARLGEGRWSWASDSVEVSEAELTVRDLSVPGQRGATALVSAPLVSARSPRLTVSRLGKSGTIAMDVPSVELADLRSLGSRLKLTGAVVVADGEASGSAHGKIDVSSLSVSGGADLVARGLRVQVGSDAYQGELRIALEAHVLDGKPETTVLSGSSLAFTSGGARGTDAWWARASLEDAEVQLADGPRFRAHVHLMAENASPVQALLARWTPVPRWVLDAFPTDDLQADGELRGTPSSLEARSLVAKSSGTSARLEYAQLETFKQGMALVSSGSLRLGFTLAGKGQPFLLFGAESWFERKVGVLRAQTNELNWGGEESR